MVLAIAGRSQLARLRCDARRGPRRIAAPTARSPRRPSQFEHVKSPTSSSLQSGGLGLLARRKAYFYRGFEGLFKYAKPFPTLAALSGGVGGRGGVGRALLALVRVGLAPTRRARVRSRASPRAQ